MEGALARSLCWHCQSDIGGEYFCQQCIKIQPISNETDYFQCLGLPRILNIDPQDLERRFHELSRRFHPDYYQQKTEQEKAISLENAAIINTAYRTLRDPIQRALYLIRLEEGAAKEIPAQAPADLFEEILELQETLQEYKQQPKSQGTEIRTLKEHLLSEQSRLEARKKVLEEELFRLFGLWDALRDDQREEKQGILKSMKGILSQRSYLETVLQDIREGL
jgi:molecular chaperone HscB